MQVVGVVMRLTTPTTPPNYIVMELDRIEKEVRLTYGKGRRGYVSVVREHYLRDDISCKTEKCCICGAQIDSKSNLDSRGSFMISLS